MSRMISKGGLFAAAATLLCASVPAQATTGCWNETQVAAAKVRDLQSRLMVATMRCRAMGIDVTQAYNRFVVANRATLQGANTVILGQFESGFGSEGQRHYDSFATSLANAYGGDETDAWICSDTEQLADEAADAKGDVHRLIALADRVGMPPQLPGGRCEISFEAPATPPEPAPVVDEVAATPVPTDRWDEIESIPPPTGDQAEAERVPSPWEAAPAPVRAPIKVEGKAELRHHI
jgi:hypothetical protein